MEYQVRLRRFDERWPKHQAFIRSRAKRRVARAGRRGAKTTAAATIAVEMFLEGRRILYAVPTSEQMDRFWYEVKRALAEPLNAGVLYRNETRHIIEEPGTARRIRAKTAWNPDTLRGDYADLLILDEFQLMDEESWGTVGAPMLLDNNGDAIFIYTPPSLHSRSATKARDPRHAAKLWTAASKDETGQWEAFHWTSRDNPTISVEALDNLASDMTSLAIRQEIEALDIDEDPAALWSREMIETNRVASAPETLYRVVIGVDPPGGATECGVVIAGLAMCACQGVAEPHAFVLDDRSLRASPAGWGSAVVTAYEDYGADRVLGEKNYGGDMVEHTLRMAAQAVGVSLSYRNVQATRGKAIRAEPIAAAYERGHVHHVGTLEALEDEMVSWVPGVSSASPNRVDAAVWALTELIVRGGSPNVRWLEVGPLAASQARPRTERELVNDDSLFT